MADQLFIKNTLQGMEHIIQQKENELKLHEEVFCAVAKELKKEPKDNKCPECGFKCHFFNEEINQEYWFDYCPDCGQALDWSNRLRHDEKEQD